MNIDENPTPPESGETLIMPWRITLDLQRFRSVAVEPTGPAEVEPVR